MNYVGLPSNSQAGLWCVSFHRVDPPAIHGVFGVFDQSNNTLLSSCFCSSQLGGSFPIMVCYWVYWKKRTLPPKEKTKLNQGLDKQNEASVYVIAMMCLFCHKMCYNFLSAELIEVKKNFPKSTTYFNVELCQFMNLDLLLWREACCLCYGVRLNYSLLQYSPRNFGIGVNGYGEAYSIFCLDGNCDNWFKSFFSWTNIIQESIHSYLSFMFWVIAIDMVQNCYSKPSLLSTLCF